MILFRSSVEINPVGSSRLYLRTPTFRQPIIFVERRGQLETLRLHNRAVGSCCNTSRCNSSVRVRGHNIFPQHCIPHSVLFFFLEFVHKPRHSLFPSSCDAVLPELLLSVFLLCPFLVLRCCFEHSGCKYWCYFVLHGLEGYSEMHDAL